ncbi:hypothetical protein LT85_2113 [Collimonas arenae]|uniref:Uncharacterized protein n=1 Tax=Collimonas arenae TaxID=279058 RepID=A0A0A1F9W1_9BURK|nr:hypothetical protein LT85_2113 [Collimonas arenae]
MFGNGAIAGANTRAGHLSIAHLNVFIKNRSDFARYFLTCII